MPAFVAAQGFVAMLVGLQDRTIGLLVADMDGLGLGVVAQQLDLAEPVGKGDLALVV